MKRRDFPFGLAAGCAVLHGAPALADDGAWAGIERQAGGRLGVAILTADGKFAGQRLDERFPMCSTFKWLAAACVLHRVDQGQERLERRVRYGREALLSYAPVTSKHVEEGMTVAELCHAAITLSDNTAANLLLASFGGPAGLTAYARSLGDTSTRLDRWEPDLNEATPGDPRDTTTPRAMARLLHATLLGDALAPASREQLAAWLQATETNVRKLRAGLPPGWRMGSKTGSGSHGSSNDVGIFWPPQRPPVIVAVYITESRGSEADREAATAAVARRITAP